MSEQLSADENLPEVVWVYNDAGGLKAHAQRPVNAKGVKYFRVKDWRQIEKLASAEGVDADQYVTLLHERSEAQRREIARLHGLLKPLKELAK